LDFKSLVSEEDYNCLMDFVYIDSEEKLNEFSNFVRGLGVRKIQDWWDHKEMSAWIIPCLIKSQSRMSPEDWDRTPSTTNMGEAQHHWTNSLTGTKLSLVEAIESARKADEDTACDIEISLKSGVLLNSHNEAFHCMARSSQRQSTSICKAHESNKLADERARIQFEIEMEKEAWRQSSARQKLLASEL
ncbi:hypothetical protein B0H10DRAFT_1746055, partial [Mycena sp. CBHHK59/15]